MLTLALIFSCGSDRDERRDTLAASVLSAEPTSLAVAQASGLPEVMPVAVDDLQPWSGAATDGATVLMVGPQGEQERPRQAVVVFDRPMVALEKLDDMSAQVGLSCDSPGTARWAGTTTAVWIPEGGHFPRSSEVRCTVPDSAAVDGSRVKGADWAFTTSTPVVSRTHPYNGSDQVDPDGELVLVFNQPVDPDEVAQRLVVSGPDGSVKARVRAFEASDDGPSIRIPGDETRVVSVTAKMTRDSAYTLALASGLHGLEGSLGSDEGWSMSFSTFPPAKVIKVGPNGADVSPFTTIELGLATQTDAEELGGKVTISPTPPDGWDPADAWSWTTWSHGVRLAPKTTYTVSVEAGAKDVHGQKYDAPISWTFTTGHLPPMLDAASGWQVYPANNPTELPFRTRNVSSLRIGAKAVDADWVRKNALNYQTLSRPTPYLRGETVFADRAPDDGIRVDTLELAELLQDGHGMVLVEATSPELLDWQNRPRIFRSVLMVTDLGATLKLGPDGVTTWVTSLSDGQPVVDARVRIYQGDTLLWTGQSDGSGLAVTGELPIVDDFWDRPVWAVVDKDGDTLLTTTNDPNRLWTWDHDIYAWGPTTSDELRTHAFTDRGVYKPGDTVHVAVSARRSNEDGLQIVAADGSWTCSDGRGGAIAEGTLTLDRAGTAAFDVALPKEMSYGSGSCSIELNAEDLTGSQYVSIPVHAFRAPTFRVDVSAPESHVGAGRLNATGSGRFLFGSPMGGAEATWVVRTQDVAPDVPGWDAFRFAGDESRPWWDWGGTGIETLAEGSAVLTGQGEVPIEVELGESDRPRKVEVEVTVTDVARQKLSGRSHVLVHPADFYLGIKPGRGVGVAGEAFRVDVVAAAPDGAAQKGVPVELEVLRRTWESMRKKGTDGRWTWESVATDEAVTTVKGRTETSAVVLEFTPPEGGYYVLRVTAKDSKGRRVHSEDGVYVAGPGASWAQNDGQLVELVPDKREYEVGDTARILVKAPKAGLNALVTVERETVIERRVVKLKTTAETLEIPLGENAAPNVYVSVVLTDGAAPVSSPSGGKPAFLLGYQELAVSPEGRRVTVDLDTDRQVYAPGDTVKASVAVALGGEPAGDARVVLYAVDYGVLSLTNYQTPDPFERFWQDHDLHIVTADSRTRVVDRAALLAKGAPAGGGGGMADDGPGLRARFQTTPLWEADLATDATGKLELDFELPDNLTTFKLMAVVYVEDDAFGSADHELQVSRPLIASPALPRVLRVGDRALAGVVVHNNVDREREVHVVAEADGLTLGGSPISVKVPAQGSVEVPFSLIDPLEGEVVFRFDVQTDDGDRDRVEHRVTVQRPRPAEVVATAGVGDTTMRQPITIPADAQPGVGGLTVSLSPTVLVGSGDSLGYLVDYPHGCLEQTSSRLLALSLAKELGPRAGLEMEPEAIDERIAVGLARIRLFETWSGGYAYWPGSSEPRAVATAHAVEALHALDQPVSPKTVAFLHEFLDGRWTPRWWGPETTTRARARVALTLARIGQPSAATNNRLWAEREHLGLVGRAELAETIARTSGGGDWRVRELLRELEGHLVVDGTQARIVADSNDMALWEGDALPTAAGLQALLAAGVDNPLTPRLAQGLVGARKQGRWGNTYTTIRSFQALFDYVQKYEDSNATGFTLSGLVDATDVLGTDAVVVSAGLDSLKSGELVIEPQGRVYWEARLAYGQDEMPPRDEGFTVQRTMAVLEGSGSGGSVTPGSLVQVTLRISTPITRYDVAVVDPLPAGLESVNSFFATTAGSVEMDDSGWTPVDTATEEVVWSDWVFNHRELRDDAVVLYADWMPPGVHVYTYLARATTPGDYSHPAAHAEEMYRPEVFGRTEQGRFVVGTGPVAKK